MAEKPIIETTRNTFKVILPNRNVRQDTTDISVSQAGSNDVTDLLKVRPSTAAG